MAKQDSYGKGGSGSKGSQSYAKGGDDGWKSTGFTNGDDSDGTNGGRFDSGTSAAENSAASDTAASDVSSDSSAAESADLKDQEAGFSAGQSGFYKNDPAKTSATDKYAGDKTGNSDSNNDINYTPDDKAKNNGKGFWNKRKAGVAGGLLGVLGLGGFGIFGIIGNQFINLEHILDKNYSNQQEEQGVSNQGLVRYLRTGEVGETRLGYVQSKINASYLKQLSAAGVTFQTDKFTGRFNTMEVDTTKNSTFNSAEDIAKAQGVDVKNVVPVEGKPGTFRLDLTSTSIGTRRGVLTSALDTLHLNSASSTLSRFVLSKYSGAPSMFSPIKRLKANATQKFSETYQSWQSDRSKQISTQFDAVDKGTTEDLRSNSSGIKKGVVGALTFTGGACMARAIAQDTRKIDNLMVQQGAAEAAQTIGMGIGAEYEAGGEINPAIASGQAKDFKDTKTGTTIWDDAGLRALAGESGGVDIGTTNPGLQDALAGSPLSKGTIGQISESGVLQAGCSKAGMLLQFAAGTALFFLSDGTAAAAGAGTTETIVTKLGTFGIQNVKGYLWSDLIQKFVPQLLAKDVLPKVISGAEGGAIMSYGARLASSTTAASLGGVTMTSSQAISALADANQEDQAQFQSKNFFCANV